MADPNGTNPLFDPATDNAQIADDTQQMLNQPLAQQGLSTEDQMFLNQILSLVEEGKLKLYQPSTLLNTVVYDGLAEEAKGKADQNAMAMLAKVRDIVNLKQAGMENTMQMENLVHSLRLNKENMETHGGDIFII